MARVQTKIVKDADYENFPVSSWLLAGPVRAHVACFYAFARAADDIADDPGIEAEEKIRRLQSFENALLGEANDGPPCRRALDMAESLRTSGVSSRHCLDLLAAFRQDAVKSRYRDWPDLLAYCRLSAAPVGRYLIDLHGGSRLGYQPSDALCAALQLINHLQDCGDDYRTLGRVYLPGDWLDEAAVDMADLAAGRASAALRKVFDRTIEGIDRLLRDARPLASGLYSGRLALEASVIYQIARALNRRLARNDPLLRRVELSRTGLAGCAARGVAAGIACRW